ncbi:MAG TPA: TonB-dependent receptor, partial [Prolixibacteraceae bacterium]|nr:TonB-dependent receptor [Prolixibacteraceae bacterium]
MKKFEGEASLGIISSRLSLEGPIVKDKTSFIVSGRRTYGDLLLQPLLKLSADNLRAGYYFYDLNAKINHIFSEKSRLYLSGYFGQDKLYVKDKSEYTTESVTYKSRNEVNIGWQNATGALRWNYLFSNKLFGNFIATYSNYNFFVSYDYRNSSSDSPESRDFFKYLSGIDDWSAKAEFDYFPLPQHAVKFGSGYIYHTFEPGVTRI